jgi:tetratricopeptide (TPR) repeat protein
MLNVEGAAQVAKGDLAGARATFERALELNPNHPEVLNNLAYVHELRGDLVTALNTYRRALEANPTQAETYLNIEEIYRKGGRNQEAMEILDRLEAARGGRTADVAGVLAFRRAVNTLALGDTTLARSRFEEAVAADPRQASAWLTLSMLCRRLNDNEKALEAAQKAAALSPQAPEVQVNLARCLENVGRVPEALDAFAAAVAAGGGSPDLYYRQGTLLLAQGRHEEGEQALLRANQGRPHPPALLELGKYYEGHGRTDEAKMAYEALIKINGPEAGPAKARLRGLGGARGHAGR